jgi:subfamily B ATP-binding cassette protein MsbA
MKDFRRIFRFVRPYAGFLVISLVLLAFSGAFEALTTALTIPLFDNVLIVAPAAAVASPQRLAFFHRVFSSLPGGVLVQLSIALVLLTCFKGVCLYHSNYLMGKVGQHVVMDLRNALYAHLLDQSMGFFSLNSTGRLMSRMSNDVEQVQEAVSTTLAELFREVVLLIALVVASIWIDVKAAALALLIAPGALLMTLTMGRRIRRASLRSRENIATLSDLLQQSITGIRIVKAFGMEIHERERFRRSALDLFWTNLKASRVLFLNSPLMEILGVVAFVPLLF